MVRWLYLLPAGIFSHAFLPVLPASPWLVLLLAVGAALLWPARTRAPGVLLLGLAIGGLWGNEQMRQRLPVHLDKSEVVVAGVVSSLVMGDGTRAVFNFRVMETLSPVPTDFPPLATLRLTWYGEAHIRPGEYWQLRVRLRTPRGFSNPGGFDYSGWLLSQDISATGYVRDGSANRRLAAPGSLSLPHIRDRILDRLRARQDLQGDVPAVMAALILGEQGLIPRDRFEQLRRSGTVHLVVVSGLHIGMVCGLGLVLGMALGRLAAGLGGTTPARIAAIPVALLLTAAYGLLAGLDLPVQRALIMSTVAMIAVAARRTVDIWRLLALALLCVALVDPLAATSAGFWLSFMAVFGLVAWFTYRRPRGWLAQLGQAQLVVFVVLAPFLTWFQGSVSLWSLPVNLVAIPWVSLVIVPCCLLGALLQPVPVVGDLLWTLAGWQLSHFLALLDWVANREGLAGISPFIALPSRSPLVSGALLLVALILLSPRGWGRGVLALLLVTALALQRPAPAPALELAVLDVGQGLAAVIRVGHRVLVYDTGPGFPSGFNTGDAVVAPYLDTLGVGVVERLVVSHGDSDHAGGVEGLARRKRIDLLLAGQPARLTHGGGIPCRQGDAWSWDWVRFSVLWPPPRDIPARHKGNNHSCVLLVEAGDVRLLLPGDIEAAVEQRLVMSPGVERLRNLTLLVAPHHGSKTSSSAALVSAVSPRHVVFTAGFNHHFGHPHPEVVDRYRQRGTAIWQTALSGALVFRWDEGGGLEVVEHRRENRRYWH